MNEPKKPTSEALATVAEISTEAERLGWCAEALRELAATLDPGDRIGEIRSTMIEILPGAPRAGVLCQWYPNYRLHEARARLVTRAVALEN